MTHGKRIDMNRRTLLRTTLVGAVATLVLASCSSETSLPDGELGDPNSGTLTFWDNNAGPDRTPLYEELIRRFEEVNPGIDIQYVGLPSDSAQQKYQTALAGGSAPDLGIVSTAYLAPLVAQDAVIPLDDFMASSPQRGEYDPKIIESATSEAARSSVRIASSSVSRRRDSDRCARISAPASTPGRVIATAILIASSSRVACPRTTAEDNQCATSAAPASVICQYT